MEVCLLAKNTSKKLVGIKEQNEISALKRFQNLFNGADDDVLRRKVYEMERKTTPVVKELAPCTYQPSILPASMTSVFRACRQNLKQHANLPFNRPQEINNWAKIWLVSEVTPGFTKKVKLGWCFCWIAENSFDKITRLFSKPLALYIRYTSLKAYKLMMDEFKLPTFSLLQKILWSNRHLWNPLLLQ